MGKHFNTAGPGEADLHYLIDPRSRVDLAEIESLIEQRRYFVLHAPRQTGKTTCLLALRDHFNAGGRYAALYVNVEAAQAMRSDVYQAMEGILVTIIDQAQMTWRLDALAEERQTLLARGTATALAGVLKRLSELSPKPVVLFLDEVDALVGDTLISLLRQIRAGYTDRPKHFPQTIVLCGVRDVRDYRLTRPDGEVITGGSAFNIKAESIRLGDFSRAEMEALYAQHTASTGQIFTPEALELAWTSTQGQPWLVNALAEQAVWKIRPNRDRSVVIDEAKLREAREALILRNDTHLDQLTDKLREERVRRVIEPMLMGGEHEGSEADVQYVLDLGLIRRQLPGKNLAPSNAIYAEVLPRVLNSVAQGNMHEERIRPSWLDADGKLDPRQFLLNFLDFWREHGEVMMGTVPYHEAAPHLVLMAYLQRVVNGEGRIEREYAAGSGRLDLLLVHGESRMAIEVKRWRTGRPDPLAEGLEQIERYLARLGLPDGYLVIFDQRADAPAWERRMQVSAAQTATGRPVLVLRG
jgi:type II secretory pathway predicted ATPase ExeA